MCTHVHICTMYDVMGVIDIKVLFSNITAALVRGRKASEGLAINIYTMAGQKITTIQVSVQGHVTAMYILYVRMDIKESGSTLHVGMALNKWQPQWLY